jgi:hypothetical protein
MYKRPIEERTPYLVWRETAKDQCTTLLFAQEYCQPENTDDQYRRYSKAEISEGALLKDQAARSALEAQLLQLDNVLTESSLEVVLDHPAANTMISKMHMIHQQQTTTTGIILLALCLCLC